MSQSHRKQRSLAALVGSIAFRLLRIGYLGCRLGVLYAVVYAAPYVPTILRRVAFLGMALWVVSELVARRLSPSSP